MKKLILMALLMAGINLGNAVSVTALSGLGEPPIRLFDGTIVPDGAVVSLGTFDFGPWLNLGVTQIRTLFGEPGHFAETWSVGDSYAGVKLWVSVSFWDGVASQVGTFSSSAANWRIPADPDPLTGAVLISTAEADEVRIGSIGTDGFLRLTQVPEPASVALFAIAGLALFVATLIRNPRI